MRHQRRCGHGIKDTISAISGHRVVASMSALEVKGIIRTWRSCLLMTQSGHGLLQCTCLLLTQSGHERQRNRILAPYGGDPDACLA
jgi:hypothetical protein